ncbi:Dev_Cell_Death domain-containing protein [Gossypium australe]|uniref:Dev_Cell_Death domain-containing protein n=1 Tax=Gossypium australe TaxID=47621 RepID=A0A5B6WZN4_9ROSI|nr:Dev_Cell_Death domain-containing protein [Gossypium australe]
MEQENNKNEGESAGVGLALSQASEKKSSNLSKAKSDIAKSMARNFLKTRKATHTSEVWRRNRKKKNNSLPEGSKVTENDAKKQNSREEIQKNEENTYGSGGKEKSSKSSQSSRKQRRGGGPGLLNKNRTNEEKLRGNKRRKWNEQMEKRRISENNNKNKEKNDGKGTKQENKMKERIDGIIFLCNAKTKPDCFRYRVMGVSNGKKDLVLGIRRGLKLFLYDYDLKLMYGVYKASTSGGMKLEPEAFGGAFPAQVRFSVHADCFPLAESIFKKAIKENYNKNNKFKTELTARQVRKLTKLFRPVAVHSTALPVHSPPSRAAARIREHLNREAHDRPREARLPSDREASARDPYANISARSYRVLSHERDRQITYGELPSARREDIHRDLYLNENDYGSYGFQGERRNSSFQPHTAPRLGSYHRDYNEQPLCQPEMAYRESVPIQRNIIPSDPLYLPQRQYRSYDLGATQAMQSTVTAATANTSVAAASTLDSYAADPYYSQYYGGETHLIESDHLRRENNQVDRSYLTYASDALADYNQMQRHHDVKPVPATSVSYRYSFTGASFSYL